MTEKWLNLVSKKIMAFRNIVNLIKNVFFLFIQNIRLCLLATAGITVGVGVAVPTGQAQTQR